MKENISKKIKVFKMNNSIPKIVHNLNRYQVLQNLVINKDNYESTTSDFSTDQNKRIIEVGLINSSSSSYSINSKTFHKIFKDLNHNIDYIALVILESIIKKRLGLGKKTANVFQTKKLHALRSKGFKV